MTDIPLDNKIEAALFIKGEPISVYELARLLEVDVDSIEASLAVISEKMSDRGIRVMRNDYFVELRSAPECAHVVEKLISAERQSELSMASAETLSIILYQGPVSSADISQIRGVNSRNILRSLSVRGLIDKEYDSREGRHVYKPSMDLLAHFGVSCIEQLPDYKQVRIKMQEFINLNHDNKNA
jgi:segregation and condensation protein B